LNNNYPTLSSNQCETTGKIIRAPLKFTAELTDEKPYDRTRDVDLRLVIVEFTEGLVNNEFLTLGADFMIVSAQFDDENAGVKNVTVRIALDNTSRKANNYVLANTPYRDRYITTGNIYKVYRSQLIINNPGTKIYGIPNITLTCNDETSEIIYKKLSGPGIINGDILEFTSADIAGDVVLKAFIEDTNNYYETESEELTFTIEKASLGVKANDDWVREGDPISNGLTFKYTEEDFKFNQGPSVLEDPPQIQCDYDPMSTMGYPPTLPIYFVGGDNDPRYWFQITPGILNIISRNRDITYGDSILIPTFDNVKINVFPADQDILYIPDKPNDDGELWVRSLKSGGPVDIVIPVSSGNITIRINVNPATLIYCIDPTKSSDDIIFSRRQGEPNPPFDLSVKSGFVYNDNEENAITREPVVVCSGAPDRSTTPGVFSFVVTTPAISKNNNYLFEYVLGKLEVLSVDLLPTAFTPEGRNNWIWPWSNSHDYKVKIFNRLGTLIFEGNNGWEGRDRNGRKVEAGVYYYIVTSPRNEVSSGTVEVIYNR